MARHLALLLLSMASVASAAEPQQAAMRLLDRLEAGQFDEATRDFTPEMAKAIPADKLAAVWNALPAQVGALKQRGQPRQADTEAHTLVVVPLHFERGDLNALVSLDQRDRIAGLLLQPAVPPAPPLAADAGFSEREVQVAGLPGLLALPDGAGPFPAVVLVHGSGPQDRDETIGANRPFLDVARGLAAQGIATLRYDKRTRARPQDFSGRDFGLDEETIGDAVAAVALLAVTPGIDPRRIHVMGHSQGGMLAPRIAARSGKVAGLVLWAAPARPLLDLLPEQNRYLLSLDGDYSAEDRAHVAEIERQIRVIRDGSDPSARLIGAPASYWRDADRVNPVADLAKLDLPVLWLQGERDFQVTRPDWDLWKKALAGNGKAALRLYPALNHLGIAGSGPSSLAEYHQPGHVDGRLIADMAAWVRARPGTGASP
ncbi:alpha/beta hydrolase [[Pseudomonas] boreopolis]|uniref:alpha/beta hydrolase n=1 Tax=Xanthomonas boreopolis TaxID=86183 RepID=UPI003DA19D2E